VSSDYYAVFNLSRDRTIGFFFSNGTSLTGSYSILSLSGLIGPLGLDHIFPNLPSITFGSNVSIH